MNDPLKMYVIQSRNKLSRITFGCRFVKAASRLFPNVSVQITSSRQFRHEIIRRVALTKIITNQLTTILKYRIENFYQNKNNNYSN